MTHLPPRSLALRQQLLALSAEIRVEAILQSPHPAEAVRSLSAQELYLTVSEAGIDEAAPLLPLATRHQLEFFLDIDAWSGDQLDLDKLCRWLTHFASADPELIGRLLREADESLVVALLSRLLHVYKNDESTDAPFWPPDRPLTTLDQMYYFEPREGVSPEAFDALHQGMLTLRGQASPAYEALLEQVLWQIPAEQQEEALRTHNARLSEKGFPDLVESLQVWSAGREPLRDLRARLAQQALNAPDLASAEAASATSALTVVDHNVAPRLARLAAFAPRAAQEALIAGLVRLGNRYAVASRAPLGDVATHRDGLRTALAHANLGVAELAREAGDDLARRAVAAVSPVELVQVGVGAVQARAWRARRLVDGWLATVPLAEARLDEEHRAALRGMRSPCPYFSLDARDRPFQELDDLQRVDQVLSALEQLGLLLEKRWQVAAGHDLPELAPLPAARHDAADLDWSAVLLTALAHVANGTGDRPAPFAASRLRAAARALTPERITRLCAEWSLDAWTALLIARIADEPWIVAGDELPDPRFVRSFLIARH